MASAHIDKRIAAHDQCVVRNVLDRHAIERPDKVFLATPDGRTVTYREMRELVLRTAGALHGMGVRQDDFVMSWLPNGLDIIKVLLATNYLGAVHVPINIAYRGGLLEHVIGDSGATVLVAQRDLVARLSDVNCGNLKHLVIAGGEAAAPPGLNVHSTEEFAQAAPLSENTLQRDISPWDIQSIIYTSGTTGRSKGVLSSYFHLWSMGQATCYYADQDDRSLCYLPFFHAASLAGFMKMLCDGGSIGLVQAFDTKRFWQDVNATRSTTCMMLGSVATFLAKQDPTDAEQQTTLKKILGAPLNADAKEIGRRNGIDVYACWNMTETSTPLISHANPVKPGTCGSVRDGVKARLVDANDCEVPVGEVGELILRTDAPWAMNSGYRNDPEATARAWRNGWFHTGDAFRVDADGEFFFVDRIKDAIRRRGENISSMEVEREVNAHPDVAESAAMAVPSEYGEDDVLIVVVPKAGCSVDPASLLEFLVPRMAYYMVPRFIRLIEQLPKTPTMKIEKHLLRKAGVTADTWDREKARIVIKRDRITAP
jgi:crotonobetaine/carnitine-CoA ligase